MSWNESDLYWKSLNDTDLRNVHGAASTGNKWSSEITGYQHLVGRDQKVEKQPTIGADGRHSDVSQVCCYFSCNYPVK